VKESLSNIPSEKVSADIIKTAKEALAAYRTSCFWSLSPDFIVTAETIPIIINGLRRHGDRKAFQLAAQLCR
jgi:hypothetical protein